MATSIVPELMYFYIPLGLVSLWKLHPARYNHLQIYRVNVTVATSPFPTYYDRTFPLLMGLLSNGPLSFDLNQVPYLRITQQLIDCLDFTSFENKEGVGSLYDRHRERDLDHQVLNPLLLLLILKFYLPPSPLNTWLFTLLCMRVCNNFYSRPDFYTGSLLSN
jgi:hypothetical protein